MTVKLTKVNLYLFKVMNKFRLVVVNYIIIHVITLISLLRLYAVLVNIY